VLAVAGVAAIISYQHAARNRQHKQTMTAMNHWQLPLDGLDQARSLHRMLTDRKLTRLDEFAGSPHIATIQHRLADMIASAEPGKPWDHWRQAEHHQDRIQLIRTEPD
jgi:hypothetical protein